MWQGASEQKIAATRGYGATVDLEATGPGDAFDRLDELIEETGRTLVHPFDDPVVLAGAGTVGLEIEEDAPDADAVIVPVGGGGLIAGIQTAIGAPVRVIAVEPETSPALHAGDRSRRAAPVTPTLDRRRPQRAVRRAAAARDLARPRARARHRGRDRARLPLPLRARQARLRAGRRRRHRRLARRQGRGRATRSLVVSGGNVAGRNRLCYPGPAMKAEIHPEYVFATVHCSCGNTFVTRSTKPELHVEICSQCHPFYTGKQKLVDTGGRVERFQRRLEKAERAARATVLSHGTGDRRPGRPRGRDDARSAQLGRRRAQARRRDRARPPPDRSARGAPLGAAPADRPRRRRARREPRDRLPRARGLGELRGAGGGRRRRGAGGDRPLDALLLVRRRDRLRGHGLQGRPGAPHRHASDLERPAGSCSSRADPRHRLRRLPGACSA